MTTETVAVLFTDIVDSTALSSRLTPEVADQARRTHFSILRQAVAESGGTEVKHLGDGLMVVFRSSSVAMACAVAMQQGVERGNRAGAVSVGLRIGLGGGEVANEDEDYFGDPVVEAARLCSLCGSGQILATDLTRVMAGRRNRHRCVPVGPLSLKGFPDPVETVEVAWEPLEAAPIGSIPLPRRLAVRPEVGVVGRESEAILIADAAKRVSGGEGREVLLVSGEAGQGKTTLVAQAARAAFRQEASVMFGHCEEDLATPYRLFSEALGHYIAHADEDRLRAHVEMHGSGLAGLVPALSSRIPGLPSSRATDADSDRYLMFAAVVDLLAQISRETPVVLVLDDLQWADKGSLQLLSHVVASEQPMRVLVLATYRDSELSRAQELVETLGALHRHRGVSRLELGGLGDDGVISLMEAASGQTLEQGEVGLGEAIYRETDGNPFFVTELLRHLTETGAIYRDDTGRWVAIDDLQEAALPQGVREVIGARVVRLGTAAGEVLSVASVIGRDFDFDLLVRTTRSTEDEVLDVLDAGAAAALVRELDSPPGRYSFAHALIQRTLYEDLGPTRRARAHRRVAEALEAICAGRPGDRVEDLARHWFSTTHDRDKALDYSRQAADAALDSLDPGDALRYYTQALELLAQISDPDPVLGIDLAIGLGTAQRQSGDPAYRQTLLDAAREAAGIDDTERLVAAALANDRGVSMLGFSATDEVEVCELALDRLPDDHPDRALILAMLCAELPIAGSFARRQALAEEALTIAEESADDFTVVRVLNHIVLPMRVPQLLEQSLSRSGEALARAERIGDPVLTFWSASARQAVALGAGDIEEVDRTLTIAGILADQLDQPTLNWVHTVQLGTRAQIAGDTDRAEQLANQAFKIGTDGGEPDASVLYGAQMLAVSWQRGTLGHLVPLIETATLENPGVPALTAALALAHVERDDIDGAHRILEQPTSTDFDLPLRGAWLTEMVFFAEVVAECQDAEAAGVVFRWLEPCSGQFAGGGRGAEGPVDQYLGHLATLLGRFDEADAYFGSSAATNNRMGAKFFEARTTLLWGRMLAERRGPGDVERARSLLTEASETGVVNGYGNVVRRAATALQRLG